MNSLSDTQLPLVSYKGVSCSKDQEAALRYVKLFLRKSVLT